MVAAQNAKPNPTTPDERHARVPRFRASQIQIFANGQGRTLPPSVTGAITLSAGFVTALPVTVSIGGVDAPVQFKGAAPDAVAGLFQVNAVVPQGVTPGPAVPIVLTVGGVESQAGATMAVQ